MKAFAVISSIIIVILTVLWIGLRTKAEKSVDNLLRKLPKNKYLTINNIRIIDYGHEHKIDHVVVSIYGIFVIEVKSEEGCISGGEYSSYWTRDILGHKTQFRNPIQQDKGHIRALKHLFKDFGEIPCIPIVAFSRQAELKLKETQTAVVYWSDLLKVIGSYDSPVISRTQVQEIHRSLMQYKVTARSSIATGGLDVPDNGSLP